MFGHSPSHIATVRHALAVTLFYSVSLMALPMNGYAVSFGQTTITSAQHEPLKASIAITDFKPPNFSITLANSEVYQKLGLTSPASLSARFVPNSATSGHIIIRTSQPVAAPFADLVLSINEQGQRTMVPKTLLLPLSGHGVLTPLNNKTLNDKSLNNKLVNDKSDKNPTLASTVNLQVSNTINTQPLTVTRGAPPPLFTTSDIQEPMPLHVQILTTEASLPALTINTVPAIQEFNVVNNTDHNNSANRQFFSTENIKVVETLPLDLTIDKPFDTLNIQVKRSIQVANKEVIDKDTRQPAILVDDTSQASKPYELEARVIKTYTQ